MKTFKRLCCGTLAALTAVLMFPTASLAADVGQEATLYQVSHKRTSNTLDIAPIMTDTHFVVHSDSSTGKDTLYDMEGYRVFTANSGDIITGASKSFLVCSEDYIHNNKDDIVNITHPGVYAYEIGKWDKKIGPYNDIVISGSGKYLIASDDYGVHIIGGDSIVDLDGYMGYSAGDDYVGIIDFGDDGNLSHKLYDISNRKTVTLPDDIISVNFSYGSSSGVGVNSDMKFRLINYSGNIIMNDNLRDRETILPIGKDRFVAIRSSLPDFEKVVDDINYAIDSEGYLLSAPFGGLPIYAFGDLILTISHTGKFYLDDIAAKKFSVATGDWVMKLADGSLVIIDSENGTDGNYGKIYSADGKLIGNAPLLFYSRDVSGQIEIGKNFADGKFTFTYGGKTKRFDAEQLLATDKSALIKFAGDSEYDSSTGVLSLTGEDYLIPAKKGNALVPMNMLSSLSLMSDLSVDSLYHTFENGDLLYVFANADGTTSYYRITFDTIPFYDVEKSQWFYDAVNYSFGASIMRGTTPTVFEPNTSMTRAMLVTVIHRLAGEPEPESVSEKDGIFFDDSDYNGWYGKALKWASENGIVNGKSPTIFDPNAPVTREEIATMMYRYVDMYENGDVSAKADLSSFPDVTEVSDWAKASLEWANSAGLISGKKEPDGSVILAPGVNTTRAEVSTILMRYNNK